MEPLLLLNAAVAVSFAKTEFFVPAKRQVDDDKHQTDQSREHPVEGKGVAHLHHEPVADFVDDIAFGERQDERGGDRDFKPIERRTSDVVMRGFLVLGKRDLVGKLSGYRVDRALQMHDFNQAHEALNDKIKGQRGKEDQVKSNRHEKMRQYQLSNHQF